MKEESLRSKFRGALLGTAVGDVLGMPVENHSYIQIQRAHGRLKELKDGWLPRGTYTDDTQLMIALAECLAANKAVNQDDLARRIVEIYDNFRGHGVVIRNFVNLMDRGWGWRKARKKILDTFTSAWNGSAMRIAPVGAFYANDLPMLKKAARLSGEVTHCGALAQDGCTLQALAVGLAVRAGSTKGFDRGFDKAGFLKELAAAAREEVHVRRLRKVEELLQGSPSIYEVIKAIGNTVEVQNSVPTAIYCFLRSPDNFEETVSYAVCLGGDADTIGAMAGAISGALNGVEAIPSRWLDGLEERERISGLADKLFELA